MLESCCVVDERSFVSVFVSLSKIVSTLTEFQRKIASSLLLNERNEKPKADIVTNLSVPPFSATKKFELSGNKTVRIEKDDDITCLT